MRILLLSAYDAQSHQRWRTELVERLPQHDWQVLSLPARQFNWRFRSNGLHWFLNKEAILRQPYDLLIATSMVDLVGLRGLVAELAKVPAIYYFHENQFAYPRGDQQHSTVELQLSSVQSALAASELVFNSIYNRDSFLHGVDDFLRSMPDKLQDAALEKLTDRCRVLAVPLLDLPMPAKRELGKPLQIVWNHRWEFDKGPERLLAFAKKLVASGIDFKLHVLGQQFRQQPEEFRQLHALLSDSASGACLGQWGYLEDLASYHKLLQQCDLVLSTAVHDFQGLAVLEAVQHGCIPLVPNRLAYPEWFPAGCCYPSRPGDLELEADYALAWLEKILHGSVETLDLNSLAWSSLGPQYEKLIQDTGLQ